MNFWATTEDSVCSQQMTWWWWWVLWAPQGSHSSVASCTCNILTRSKAVELHLLHFILFPPSLVLLPSPLPFIHPSIHPPTFGNQPLSFWFCFPLCCFHDQAGFSPVVTGGPPPLPQLMFRLLSAPRPNGKRKCPSQCCPKVPGLSPIDSITVAR